MIFKGSRYEKVPTAVIVTPGGGPVRYLLARRIPETAAVLGHRVVGGERLDHISWQHFRDAERFWRIGDANLAMDPDALLEPGAILAIPTSGG
jgi:hypothetical protein